MTENTNSGSKNDKPGYLLLFRGGDWDENVAPEELQKRMSSAMAWFDSLQKKGIVKGGQPLDRAGKTVTGGPRATVADGPFAESKEAVGGYLMLDVDDMEQAVAIAKECPMINYGISVEVRPVLEECPIFKRARERMAQAAA